MLEKRRLYLPEHVGFRPVDAGDNRFLYRLLVERYQCGRANIAGMATDALPSYEKHCAFLDGSPYRRHEVITACGEDAGMIYLNPENILGCFVLKEFIGRGIGLSACYNLFLDCDLPVIAYINPENRPSYRTVERLGMVRIEESEHRLGFELRRRPRNPYVKLGWSGAEESGRAVERGSGAAHASVNGAPTR